MERCIPLSIGWPKNIGSALLRAYSAAGSLISALLCGLRTLDLFIGIPRSFSRAALVTHIFPNYKSSSQVHLHERASHFLDHLIGIVDVRFAQIGRVSADHPFSNLVALFVARVPRPHARVLKVTLRLHLPHVVETGERDSVLHGA